MVVPLGIPLDAPEVDYGRIEPGTVSRPKIGEHEIYTDYDGCHRYHVECDSYLSADFSLMALST